MASRSPTGPSSPADDQVARDHLDWLVDEQSRESFPASDAPSTWAGRDRPPPGGGA
ncbi:MAG TPA: hypothetical protein VKV23_10080 [Acidimicrobiales bacterium]|jgi:hypothetical protein|nr:hypothetical protein [Acidimicrobiales bacterium]